MTGFAPGVVVAPLPVTITPSTGSISFTGIAAGLLASTPINLLLRTLSASGTPTFAGAFDLPLRTLNAHGYAGAVGTVSFTAPLRTLVVSANITIAFTTPLRTLSATGVIGVVGNVAFTTPLRSVASTATATVIASAQFQLLLRSLSTSAFAGVIGTVAFTTPRRTLAANGLNGSSGRATFSLLLRTLTTIAYPALTGTAAFQLPLRYLDTEGYASVAEHYRAWVMNARTGSLVEYDNFEFNSIVKFGDQYLASGPAGVFILGGDDDDGDEIAALIRTGLPDYGNSFLKRLTRIYVSGDFRGDMYFSTISTEDGKRTYALTDNGMTGEQQRRVPIGKGPKSVRWGLEIANKDGAKFGISKVIVYPKNLRRRIQ